MGDRKIAIYEPPTNGLPYIVVIVQVEERHVRYVPSRKEAREIAIAEGSASGALLRRAVFFEVDLPRRECEWNDTRP